tara:strand:- start:980 stop:1714 length:735 start_codon:yes stop_codon:yes gene_type:complete
MLNYRPEKETMYFINPPFGNYFSLPKLNQIKGSYTLYPREGLFLQILKTLRYNFEYGGWTNKIGLRNKGLDYAIQNYNGEIVSIAILQKEDIPKIVQKIPSNMNIEINVSCPNAEKEMIDQDIDQFIHKDRKWCIVKLSPVTSFTSIDKYYAMGFRQFHCSNTLPVKEGGLSGKALIPYNKKLISHIHENYKDTTIIAGGGITSIEDILAYKNLGAKHFAFSSVLFHPFRFAMLYYQIYKSNII